MTIGNLFLNHVLWSALAGWFLAQALKVPIAYFGNHRWNWALAFAAGGMPSSHSALVTSVAAAAGLHVGLDSPLFAVAVALAMVVVYDAAGVRRQAGKQAEKINVLVDELLQGHPISQEHLLEVLGHTPLQAFWGVILGIVVSVLLWLWWR